MGRAGAERVAASSARVADDGERLPAGEAHAWFPGTNQTVCGLALSRSKLQRFAGVAWADVRPDSGGRADFVSQVCRRCAAGLGERRDDPGWRRTAPRP